MTWFYRSVDRGSGGEQQGGDTGKVLLHRAEWKSWEGRAGESEWGSAEPCRSDPGVEDKGLIICIPPSTDGFYKDEIISILPLRTCDSNGTRGRSQGGEGTL